MTWGNPRWQRLIAWALRYSPTIDIFCGRAPTLREAWTGRIVSDSGANQVQTPGAK